MTIDQDNRYTIDDQEVFVETQQIHIPDNAEYRELKSFIEENRQTPGPLIQVLHRAQKIFGYLPQEVQHFVALEMRLPHAEVYGVVTFYNFFRTEPIGDHIVNICLGTACHVKGASEILKAMEKELGIRVGGTTKDRFLTLSTARCFGACGLAPVMMVDEEVYGRLNPQKSIQILKDLRNKQTVN
ncbi:MAG: NAD(P)H-dependent oxidoreductase subunit E [Spirochaetales bacterium]|nr:MAG: NAD(P)H-dependent oxidoreductase subunit E [Spirochaetales bacterium]